MSNSGIREYLGDAWAATKDVLGALSHPRQSLEEILSEEAEIQREAIKAHANGVSPEDDHVSGGHNFDFDDSSPSIGL